ncbi:hypothetical protein N7G274_007130 [Stereocaulon virgatum]|uniref:Arrestin-like N-terminal domain-containing protein n=1 Tax=Stereocaulon virgatum TaxID=373712 RepID=A0ABR4A2R2_9LECA
MTTARTTRKSTKHPSLFARCTAPFASKQSSFVEQEIRFEEPYRQHSPGEIVKGVVHVNFPKALRITHLVLRLHGFVKVISRAKLPGEEIKYDEKFLAAGGGRGRRGMEYYGDGFAKLFEEDNVLCGEGRVLGKYEFHFEMILPSRGLPTSINFEHGVISYLLSSTVTRPTAIAPTSTLHHKLNVQEIIDVAPIPKPKPQMRSLEASHKKRKTKTGTKKKEKTSLDSANSMHSPTSISPAIEEVPPRSPVPSEISSASMTSSSIASNRLDCGTPALSELSGATQEDTAYAKTELLQGGCLAGDALPIRIEIHHTKPVKNMQGVIITLFRLGRIDTHPAIPLGVTPKGRKPKYEDYYPRSRTGLGGLSLSSAGSSRVFRQDLNQIFAPIIVQGTCLDQVINTSIQAPFDLFPTISCVPGAMISFEYYVEIVVDLRSRTGSQDRILDQLSITNMPQHGYGDPRISKFEGVDGISYHSTPGFNYLITDQLRRTKGVIFTKTKIIIGTRDSGRARGKQREQRYIPETNTSLRASIELGRELDPNDNEHEQGSTQMQNDEHNGVDVIDSHQIAWVPLPTIAQDVDEKTQMRRAEEMLLPSAPPPDDGDEPSSSLGLVPSAPPAMNEEDFIQRYALSAPAYDGPSRQLHEHGNGNLPDSVAPQPPTSSQDDKQELERQRLLAFASSPAAGDEADSGAESHQLPQPSAPVLYEDDVFDINDPRVPQAPPDADNDDNNHASAITGSTSHTGPANNEPGPPHSHNPGNNEDLPMYKR